MLSSPAAVPPASFRSKKAACFLLAWWSAGALRRPPCSCQQSVRLRFRFPDLLHHLIEVVACRVLHRRKLLVGLKLLQPQRLADWQHVPIVDVGGGRRADRATHTKECLVL